jgi:pimeloyl-ACP methyl ester carboxylesterase
VLARSADGTKLQYDRTGRGVPVLLVMGLGMTAAGWWRTVPVLAERLQVLTFDNRGVGRSDRPAGPYTLAQMADDAIAVLDAVGADRAHVYGISMGGMIAQHIALRYPHRVRALVLGATTAGGTLAVPPGEATIDFLRRRPSMPAEEGVWSSIPYNYSPRTREHHGDRIGEDVVHRLQFPLDAAGYAAQLAAATQHDVAAEVGRVSAPTLVVHGADDVIVPPENGRLLAGAIPGAHLGLLEDAAHLYTTDAPEADREVLRFLVEHARARQGASGSRRAPARTARAGRA